MKAVVVEKPGGPEMLKLVDIPAPIAGDEEILIRVQAGAINRMDILGRRGGASDFKKTTALLGVEVAGIVEQVGQGVTSWKRGDKVMGLVTGGYAEYAVMPANRAMPIPEELSFVEAAAIPEVFLTAYQTLFWIGKLQKKETVLIHAGASGVGTAAIQLAKKVAKATVIVTTGSDDKAAFCKELGADYAINYKKTSFEDEVASITNGQGVNLILDFIGASYWKRNIASASIDGRIVLIGILGGREAEPIDLMMLMGKRLQVTGTLLTPRSDEYKAQLSKELSTHILPLFSNGEIKPIIDRIYPLEEIAQAHIRMEDNQNVGKLVFRIDDNK
ncbi:alcohol dehydrogenase [Brevibacillus reuszeri]|uniref:Alcohol dehydrogenase n=1 Tax=Brevibacillus reuszeri TaxID=54915 RepID=A0A0K9YQC6_9BACL|nr:NAD(P)H-quinone oxidoreductase [Brevibacillus reuszeri]KNB70933.1 NADPH:quinone oxidoreductase [Brevibacillus reuszeri]MED1857340.1 NAD(P)H-quinone oxidoreductase [Brevibacillus reuszeri]GED66833.1 alcohol dehydrogenase [Brevibacillus reuszeri]